MLVSSTKTQMKIMFKSKEFRVAALLLFAYSCISFIYVLTEYEGMDLSIIKDANEAVCYSRVNRLWSIFYILFPFIVVLPFSTSYVDDYKNHLLPVYLVRSNRKEYFLSKLLASFIGTALVIALPCLLNLFFCNIFLPHNHNTWIGEYQMSNYYRNLLGTNLAYNTDYPQLSFFRLYLFSPFLYNLFYIILLSAFSGLLAAWVLSLSFVLRKSKLILFLPLYVIQQVLQVCDTWSFYNIVDNGDKYINLCILDYVVPSVMKGESPFFMAAVLLLLVLTLIAFTVYAIKKDLKSVQ